ncbi:hypothetical protein GBA65_05240 [Rubrobacter marinus]|uniref:Type 4 fimbrial biogenesis protein PilX N-terminal domain-containing protein n=1 Tax=Rubrobacter marinus TaxID=2653852 RepID=A0A6G8PUZ7_9ACTN|nr:hypothetical protein [Rubrobacter marinus]QIN78021.1 hypothetical protein GBA65_05240 [Rubrobacter marinus]
MLRRLARDESGMTMGLAIIMIVLIGVMGAGLLTFVQRDLETVVEVNRGQKALEMADVGVQEARRQLIADPVRQHYDRNPDNDCDAPRQRKGEDWSPNTGSPGCGSAETAAGITRSFEGGRFQVTVECYVQRNDPSTPAGAVPCSNAETGAAPEDADPRRRSFFKVVSTGLYPDEEGAKRRVEAIVQRESRPLPLAYYTPENIDLNGTVEVSGVSFFAGATSPGRGSSTKIGAEPDLLLGDWSTSSPSTSYVPSSDYNTLPRGTASTGFGAAGRVCASNNTTGCKAPPNGTSYFDSETDISLVAKEDPEAANETGTISYPFDPAARPDMELLMEEAMTIGTYYTPSGGSFSINQAVMDQAQTGTSTPVVFVDFQGAASTGSNVKFDTDYDNASAPVVLVVRNGNFDFEGSNGKKDGDEDGQAELRGVVIVEGDGSKTGSYKAAGNSELAGFVFADGDITLTGNARAESLLRPDDSGNAVPTDFFERMLAFNRIRLWSWQEVYQ